MNCEINQISQAYVVEHEEKWPMVALDKYIEPIDVRNADLKVKLSQGICNQKYFQNPKQVSKNAKSDKIVCSGQFAYNRATTRNGEKISIALRNGAPCTVSSAYQVFQVINEEVLSSEFLLLWFKRPEFDRYARYMSQGSAHEFFEFDDMCRVKIPLPPIEVQRAYVDAYKGLTALIEENEALLKSLEATAQACVAECREKWPMVAVGDYIQTFTRKNSDDLDLPFMGVNREKQIVPTSANIESIDRRKYCILKCGEFVFSGMQTGRDVCIRIALSEITTDILLSPAYTTFRVDPTKPILPEYFFLNFKSSEMDRQGWFKSDSSIRSNLDWERFCEIQIPLPPIEVQRAIVALYHCAEEARKIATKAKQQLVQVCPAMIQRASVIKQA